MLEQLYSKLKEPFKILAVASFALAVLSLFQLGPLATMLGTAVGVVLMLLALVGAVHVLHWYKATFGIRFYPNWSEVPSKFKVPETLQALTSGGAELEVVGRTCFRWLCGDEIAFEAGEASFGQTQLGLQGQIREAVESGSAIHFVLQNPNVPVPLFDTSSNERLRRHAQAAIASYESIHAGLKGRASPKLKLSFVNAPVENSMVRLKRDSSIDRLVLDLSISFMDPMSQKARFSKPILTFQTAGPESEEYLKEFDSILSSSIPKEEFDNNRAKAEAEIASLVRDYSHHSALRKDESARLAAFAARCYLAEADPMVGRVPPVCVQLLVTNQCTTHCKMCDHHKLYSPESEFTQDELLCTLQCIKDMGTLSVIVSGGEPLARPELVEVLQEGRRMGLSLGLLTNGIMRGGRPVDSDRAVALAEACSWVQLSIDSFDEQTYSMIRGCKGLHTAVESLRNLVDAGLSKIEVCFTIQKDNIDELARLSDRARQILPASVPVRLKFAHGPSGGRDFLCSEGELVQAIKDLPRRDGRFNSAYLTAMLEEDYYDYDGLSRGFPVKTRMIQYRSLGYTCHALRLTCKIDATGDVYPCCFLFDDNCASSEWRMEYRLGSLRSRRTRRVMPPSDGHNALASIWYESDRLKHFRRDLLPVDPQACYYCTRHFYQNEFLNRLWQVFEKYRQYGVIQELATQELATSAEPFWV